MYTPSSRKIAIIGNGPSLRGFDLTSLRGIATLGMNAAYRYWDQINWYPDIYVNLDDQVVVSHQEEITRLHRDQNCQLFLLHPNILLKHPDLCRGPNVFFLSSFLKGKIHDEFRTRFNLPTYGVDYFKSKMPGAITTGSHSVRFAAYLGFTEFLLLGIDCRYVELLPETRKLGGIVLEMAETPRENPNYFFSDYQRKGDRYNIPNPAIGDPRLHLNSFIALKEDNLDRKLGLTISTGSRNSALFEERVFEYRDPHSFAKRLDAVFIPLLSHETERAAEFLSSLTNFDRLPSNRGEGSVDLCLAFNTAPDEQFLAPVEDAFRRLNSKSRHFRELKVYSSFLGGADDLYSATKTPTVGPEGYAAGPNNQHFDIVFRFAQGYSHIFVMELDCCPIRPFWLDRICSLVEKGRDFWMAGAAYDGKATIKAFFHINGNAVYNVGDADFVSFYQEHLLTHFYRRSSERKYLSYDVLLFDLFTDLFRGHASPGLYRLWQLVSRKMIIDDFIVNVSRPEDRADLQGASSFDLRRMFPDASLVHGLKR